MAVTMSDSQQVIVTPRFLDRKGNPAQVDGIPEWFTDNTDVLALTPAADGMSCVVAAVGPLGTASVTLKADADMGSGRVDVFGTMDFVISAGPAVQINLDAGTPTEQP